MGKFGLGFNNNGQFTMYPSVFVNVNADKLNIRNQGPTGIVAIIGPGAGFFPPKTASLLPFNVGSPSRYVTPSDLLTALNFAARPFTQFDRMPGEIWVVPCTPATPSTYLIKNATTQTLCTLTSQVYGLTANSITGAVSTGPPLTLTLTLPLASGTIVQEVYPFSATTPIANLVAEINARSALCTAALTQEGVAVTAAASAFTGGTETAPTNTDWSDSLNALNNILVDAICVVTSTSTVHALLSAYCTLVQCRGFVGGELQTWNSSAARTTSLAALATAAAGINSPRIMHCGLGAEGYGGYKSLAPRYAALAGAIDPSVPMTQKYLDVTSLEARLDVNLEVGGSTGLLMNGVAPPVPDPFNPSTFFVSRGLSTWTGDDNLYRREHSVLAACDAIANEIQSAMQPFLGGEGTPTVIGQIVEAVDGVLNLATRPTSAIRINGYDPKTIVCTFTSDTVAQVSADITPIPPINYIAVTLSLENTTIRITTNVNLAS